MGFAIGIGISPTLGQGVGAYPGAAVNLYFAGSTYQGGTLANTISLTRATTGMASDRAGNLVSFASGIPRITDKGFLIEEATTNLQIQSNFAAATWPATRGTNTAASTTSPDGTVNAALFTEDTSTNTHFIGTNTAKAASILTYTFSMYVKAGAAGSARNLALLIFGQDFVSQCIAYFNPTTGCFTKAPDNAGMTITKQIARRASRNFWRIEITFTSDATAGLWFLPELLNGATASYTGDGVSGLYFYGAQLEQKAYATSLVPTTVASVTRNADSVALAGAAATALNAATGTALIVASDQCGTGVAATVLDSNGTTLLGYTSGDVVSDAITSGLSVVNTANRMQARDQIALSWNAAGRRLVMNGGAAVTDAVAQTPSATLKLGSTAGSSNFLNGYVERLVLWNTKQLAAENYFSLISGTSLFGVNMSGAENSTISWPSAADWTYLASKGVRVVRLPIAHENLQTALNGALSSTFVANAKAAMAAANAVGIGCILDLHNFGHYADSTVWGSTVTYAGNAGTTTANCYALGGASYTQAHFVDVWTKMATTFAGSPGLVAYELMNEPINLSTRAIWPAAAQAAITAVRAIDATTPIYTAGNDDNSFGSGGYNAAYWTPPTVSGSLLRYEAHQYFDGYQGLGAGGNYAGTFTSYSVNIYSGVQALVGYAGWSANNGVTAYLGELGVPNSVADNDPQWLKLQERVWAYLAQNNISASIWFYGSNGSGGGSALNIGAVADDVRLLTMLGRF